MPGRTAHPLRHLPSVARVLESRPFAALLRREGRALITDLLRARLDALRERLRAGDLDEAGLKRRVRVGALAGAVERAAARIVGPSPRAVVNATGVVVHTNLGRSILSPKTAAEVACSAAGYLDLEYDVAAGRRGSRMDHLRPAMERLFPGSDFLALNNNAAATMLALRALAAGREVIVSRGELVEIGGSFRVPDILEASGAKLREVGTTNRTRAADYRKAVHRRPRKAGAILKVHSSNFKVVGFTAEASVAELAAVAKETGVPLVVDWGSGDLVDLGKLGIRDERPVRRLLEDGADLVTFSGDKLLGGPQAGIVVGRPDLVAKLKADPLARVCRLDRILITALQRTLAAYVRGVEFEEIPTLQMLRLSAKEIGERASAVRRKIGGGQALQRRIAIVAGVSRPGGGSSPSGERATRLLAIKGKSGDAAAIERTLRRGDPPIVGRMQDGRLLLDLRTVPPNLDGLVAARLREALDAE